MRKLFILAAFLVLIPALFLLGILVVQPKIPVGGAIRILAGAAGRNSGSTIDIEGEYYVIPGKWLQISCEKAEVEIIAQSGSRIHLTIGNLSTKVHVPSLVKKELLLDGIFIRNLDVDMTLGKQSKNNETSDLKASEPDRLLFGLRLKQAGIIDCGTIAMRVDIKGNNTPHEFQISSITGLLKEESPGELQVEGSLASRKFQAHLRTGPLGRVFLGEPLSFQTQFLFGDSVVECTGQYILETESEPPEHSARFTTGPCDIGAILKNVGLVKGLELTVGTIETSLKTSGRRIDELISNLELHISARDGFLILRDSNTGKNFQVEITRLNIAAEPGEKTAFELLGETNDAPFHVSAELGVAKGLLHEKSGDVPFNMKIDHKGSALKIAGKLPVPLSLAGISVNVELSGKDISSLNDILGIEIPVAGNYLISGGFQIVPEGYQLCIKKALLGNSIFEGNLVLDTQGSTPELSLRLKAERIQLGDVNKALFFSSSDRDTNYSTDSTDAQKLRKLTDQTIIDSFNALIFVESEAVFSGSDYLGKGSLRILQRDGTITVSPVHIAFPDGTVDARFSIEPVENDRRYSIDIDINELDYGAVSRWFKPETNQGGTLSMRVGLKSRVKPHGTIMANATGNIDFFVQPMNLEAGVIDLWAVNLISYVTPLFISNKESTLHCIAGRLAIQDGKMKHEEILADTSRIQVKGTLEVDFERGWIESQLRPIPKRPQFYSLATPVHVSGKLDDLKVSAAKGGVIGTVIRMATSYIVVPIQWIIFEKKPRNGTEQCLQVFNGRVAN